MEKINDSVNEIEYCTRCGKKLDSLRIEVGLCIYTERKRLDDVWEEIPNLFQESTEYLCPECFEKWCDIQSQMNIPYEEKVNNKLES